MTCVLSGKNAATRRARGTRVNYPQVKTSSLSEECQRLCGLELSPTDYLEWICETRKSFRKCGETGIESSTERQTEGASYVWIACTPEGDIVSVGATKREAYKGYRRAQGLWFNSNAIQCLRSWCKSPNFTHHLENHFHQLQKESILVGLKLQRLCSRLLWTAPLHDKGFGRPTPRRLKFVEHGIFKFAMTRRAHAGSHL